MRKNKVRESNKVNKKNMLSFTKTGNTSIAVERTKITK